MVSFMITQKNNHKYLPSVEYLSYTSINYLFLAFILFENQIQTASTSPCRTQVQPAASFLVCSLIFIEYQNIKEGI